MIGCILDLQEASYRIRTSAGGLC